MPPSYRNVCDIDLFSSTNLISIPEFKKASSLNLFFRTSELKLVSEKYFLLGLNVILVPLNSVFPSSLIFDNGLLSLYS